MPGGNLLGLSNQEGVIRIDPSGDLTTSAASPVLAVSTRCHEVFMGCPKVPWLSMRCLTGAPGAANKLVLIGHLFLLRF